MTTSNIWQQLQISKIIPDDVLPSLAVQFQNSQPGSHGPSAITDWLIDQRVISPFQGQILRGGFGERLRYGNYVILDRVGGNENVSLFRAIHAPSKHKVLLLFQSGEVDGAYGNWESMVSDAEKWKTFNDPAFVPILEIVTLSEYRMIVFDDLSGSLLIDKIPDRTRLSADRSVRGAIQISNALKKLHAAGFVHGAMDYDSILLDTNGAARLLPPMLSGLFVAATEAEENVTGSDDKNSSAKKNGQDSKNQLSTLAPEVLADRNLRVKSSDAFSLGVILHRMLSGKPPRRSSKKGLDLADANKAEYPPKLNDLIRKLLVEEPSDRLFDFSKVKEKLTSLNPKPEKPIPEYACESKESLATYQEWMSTWNPDEKQSLADEVQIDVAEPEPKSEAIQLVERSNRLSDNSQMTSESSSFAQKKRRQWLLASGVSAALLALITAFLIIGYNLGKTDVAFQKRIDNEIKQENKRKKDSNKVVVGSTAPKKELVDPSLAYQQEIVEDNGETLWQSPTAGRPINFQLVPPSPRLILSARIKSLDSNEEGKLLIQSIGSGLRQWIDNLGERCGCTASEIEHLIVSLHSDGAEYQSCFVVRLASPMAEAKLISRWKDATLKSTEDGTNYYEKNGEVFFFKPVQNDQPVTAFVFGPQKHLQPVLDAGGVTRLDGTLGALAKTTDRNRHLSLLFLRSALFSEEGQKLMSGPWGKLNRALSVNMDDRIQGVRFATHLDRGLYWEATFERNVDLKSDDLKKLIEERFLSATLAAEQNLMNLGGHPYWNNIRARFDDMIKETYKQTRVGIENNRVLVNCWLPPMAAHNLVAATEVVLTVMPEGGAVASTTTSTKKAGPKTIDELLATKRDLVDANPPDLNVLLEGFKNEILGDFSNLPFEFDIVINGTDLGVDGITRNQRPTALNLKQMSVAEILTQIMFLANPDKNATSPKDVLCKLVWVVKPDAENPKRKVIEITTRKAAATKNYQLPAAFQSE